MGDSYPKVRLAAVQAAPVFLNRDASVEKACDLIEEAGQNGAQIIGLPECFVPGYPDWFNWYMPRAPESVHFSRELVKNAVEVPSPATDALCNAARRAGAYVTIGINEKDPKTMGSLYNSLLYLSPEGTIIGVHRKLVPTSFERLIHQAGDGSSVVVYDTPFGGLGGLICGENTNSLARFALLLQHERIHSTAWPAFALSHHQTNFEGMDLRVRYHAFEGRVFVISAAAVLTDEVIRILGLNETQKATIFSRGGHSGIVGPTGRYIAGPADDTEQILYADADMEQIIDGKLTHDLTGHYNRFDVFTLVMRRNPRQPFLVQDGPAE